MTVGDVRRRSDTTGCSSCETEMGKDCNFSNSEFTRLHGKLGARHHHVEYLRYIIPDTARVPFVEFVLPCACARVCQLSKRLKSLDINK